MFEIGTKVRLVASSCRKSTGPKRGSTGYVSNIMNQVVYMDKNIATCLMEVFFYRYGFEQRTRVEKQVIMNAFPVVNREKGDIHQQVRAVMNLISGRNGDDWASGLRGYYSLPPTGTLAVAVPVPANEKSLLDCQADEFKALISAIMNSNDFRMFVHEGLINQHHRNASTELLANTHHWEIMRDMSMDRGFRSNRMTKWLSTEAGRAQALKLLRMIISMRGRSEYHRSISDAMHSLSRSDLRGSSQHSSIYGALLRYLLNKPVIDQLKRDTRVFNAPSLLAYLEDIEDTRGTLLVLSSSLEKAYA